MSTSLSTAAVEILRDLRWIIEAVDWRKQNLTRLHENLPFYSTWDVIFLLERGEHSGLAGGTAPLAPLATGLTINIQRGPQ